MNKLTHVLVRIRNGDEQVIPIHHLGAMKKGTIKNGEKCKEFSYWAIDGMDNTQISINEEQYDHICSLIGVEEI